MRPNRIKLALYGVVGAMAPDVLILYSKRWTMPGLSFDAQQYLIGMGIYLLLAAVIAPIFPYRGKPTEWKAFALGVTLPIVVAGLLSTQRQELIAPRGISIPGTLLDLMSLF
jgi:hypothetical protein